jgi:hypothetical protein
MEKVDYLKDMKTLYQPPKGKFGMVDVPVLQYVMIDGHGNPNTHPDYQAVVNALYSLAYGLKFALKAGGLDWRVAPLEGLWWMENMAEFSLENKDRWDWTMMILQPEAVSAALFEQVRADAVRKKGLAMLDKARLEQYAEGTAAQTLYIGAYADEGPTIAQLHQFIHEQGYRLAGKHHEIYLGDPRRTSPERLKTIIRQPVRSLV